MNAEEPFYFANAQSSATNNTLDFGGGTSAGNAATVIRFFTAANNTTTTGTEQMRIDSFWNVGISGTDPTEAKLVVRSATSGANLALFTDGIDSGCALSNAGYITCSFDERLKNSITSLNVSALSLVNALNPVTFTWRNNPQAGTKTDFIAQEVEDILPDLVTQVGDYKGVKLVPLVNKI